VDYIELDCTVVPREPFADVLMSQLAGIGYDMFEEHEAGIRAYIGAGSFSEDQLREIPYFNQNEFCTVSWSSKVIRQQNWNETWESNFEPVIIAGKILVRAAFHPSQPSFEHELVIQPKMAFGTGHHETTSLVMAAMLKLDWKSKKVLDMGCGSGILAILAGRLGAAEIWAVDFDPIATENATENCNINGFPDVHVLTGGTEQITDKNFDIILANINRNVLLEQMPAYRNGLHAGGTLLISGFYTNDETVLLEQAVKNNFRLVDKSVMNNWSEIRFMAV